MDQIGSCCTMTDDHHDAILMMQKVANITTRTTTTTVTRMMTTMTMTRNCCHTLSPQKGSLQHQRRHSCGCVQIPPSHQRTACQHPCRTDWLPAATNTTVVRASFGLHAGGFTTRMLMLLVLTVQCKSLQVPWDASCKPAPSILCLKRCKASTREIIQVHNSKPGHANFFVDVYRWLSHPLPGHVGSFSLSAKSVLARHVPAACIYSTHQQRSSRITDRLCTLP